MEHQRQNDLTVALLVRRFCRANLVTLLGAPKGILNFESRIRRLLEGDEAFSEAIAETIRSAVGDDRQLLDALLIVGTLQALQGDEKWAKLLIERAYGKVRDKIIGDEDQPFQHTITLKIDIT